MHMDKETKATIAEERRVALSQLDAINDAKANIRNAFALAFKIEASRLDEDHNIDIGYVSPDLLDDIFSDVFNDAESYAEGNL